MDFMRTENGDIAVLDSYTPVELNGSCLGWIELGDHRAGDTRAQLYIAVDGVLHPLHTPTLVDYLKLTVQMSHPIQDIQHLQKVQIIVAAKELIDFKGSSINYTERTIKNILSLVANFRRVSLEAIQKTWNELSPTEAFSMMSGLAKVYFSGLYSMRWRGEKLNTTLKGSELLLLRVRKTSGMQFGSHPSESYPVIEQTVSGSVLSVVTFAAVCSSLHKDIKLRVDTTGVPFDRVQKYSDSKSAMQSLLAKYSRYRKSLAVFFYSDDDDYAEWLKIDQTISFAKFESLMTES